MGDSKKWQFVLTQVGSCFEKKPHYLRNNQMLPKTKSSLECSVVVLCCSTHISSYIDSANLNVALYYRLSKIFEKFNILFASNFSNIKNI